ncbi:uncharacterized protein EKO05_0005696 [Ascochyta rabiei]|uniref:Uncharacterized protein n=1 Tax=Didymella rabiei TaxID=5454 RepID=A0A163EK14_DIDRA|nr:uncharacterized protein EKO05_0005696 [Ascochyta rabiei]KZM23732.1 hypothetical protein ST47_g5131 [Ascochyta rabiei]UPX15240.1 hypothetical protein EKO05_0005696 [Ascochyta rabiei]
MAQSTLTWPKNRSCTRTSFLFSSATSRGTLTDKLQANIKAYKADYNPKDPWIWPQLRSTQHPGYHDDRQNAVALLQGIAYPHQVARQFVHPARPVKNMSWMMRGNVLFPFGYDRFGQLRTEDALGALDRWNWIYKMTDVRPAILEVEADPRPERSESTIGAFNEVIKMVNECYDGDTAEIDALCKEITHLRAVESSQKARAGKAEGEVVAASKARKAELAKANKDAKCATSRYKKNLLYANTHIQAAEKDWEHASLQLSQRTKLRDDYKFQISKAEAEIKTLKQSLKERDEEAQNLQNKAAVADEQVMKIWAERKRVREAEGGKRKGSEEVSEIQLKKMKHI